MYIICRTSAGSLKKGGIDRCISATASLERNGLSLLQCRSSRVNVLGRILGSGVGSFVSIRLRAASRVWMEDLGGGGLEERKRRERMK